MKATAEESQQWCRDMASALTEIEDPLGLLMHRSRYGTRDGYPESTRLGESGTVSTVSDPTLRLVIQRLTNPNADPVRNAAINASRLCEEISERIWILSNIVKFWTEPLKEADEAELEIERRCSNCREVVKALEQFRRGLCNACYVYERKYGRKRNVALARKAG